MWSSILNSTSIYNCSRRIGLRGSVSTFIQPPRVYFATNPNVVDNAANTETNKPKGNFKKGKVGLFKKAKVADVLSRSTQSSTLNLTPRIGKTTLMAQDELPTEIYEVERSVDAMAKGVPTYQIKSTYIEPPPELDHPVATLAEPLRGCLDYTGPVALTPMTDNIPLLDIGKFDINIAQPNEINWDSIPPFVTASRDTTLIQLGLDTGANYMGSTSSTSSILSQYHFALTCFANIHTNHLSTWFQSLPKSHTRSATKPSSSVVRKRMLNGKVVWGVDNFLSGEPKNNQVLIDLGKSLERHLTYSPEDFQKYFLLRKDENGEYIPDPEVGKDLPSEEAHKFMKIGKMFLRSQLDCIDEKVHNDKKVFDLKTRATLPIRLDVTHHESYLDYTITQKDGIYNSFEREYYDMCRSAFLKYSFQCRIGDMGGVLVAYHNTRKLFGLEYIDLDRMDIALYGDSAKAIFVYKQAFYLLEQLLDRIVAENAKDHPRDCFRVTIKAYNNRLNVFVETIPEIDCDNPEELDNALSNPHIGAMYVDRLSMEQAQAALARRGLNTEGNLSTILSRLEGAVCPSDIEYKPRIEEETREIVNQGFVKAYVMSLSILTPNGSPIAFENISDPSRLSVSWSIKDMSITQTPEQVSKLYYHALCEYVLQDGKAEQLEPGEELHTIKVEGIDINITSAQLQKIQDRKKAMLGVLEDAKKYQAYVNMEEGPEKQALYDLLQSKTSQKKRRPAFKKQTKE